MDELLKILGVNKLDESQQTLINEKLSDIIDVAARERADSIVNEEKTALVEKYELKYDEYRKDITSKFSDFVDSILDEEMELPERVLEYAKKGELYSDLIEQFKIKLSVDEGVLNDEVKDILRESKEEILKLNEQVNSLMAKELEFKEDAKILASELYLRKKCDGLLESQKIKVMGLLGDIKDKVEIDRKFKYVLENVLHEEEMSVEDMTVVTCKACGATYSLKAGETMDVCPKCGAKMDELTSSIGDGSGEVVTPVVNPLTESVNPFDDMKSKWVKILKENKI